VVLNIQKFSFDCPAPYQGKDSSSWLNVVLLGQYKANSEVPMTERTYTPQMAVKVSAVVPEDGELRLELPFAAGRQVDVFVVAEELPPFKAELEHALPAAEELSTQGIIEGGTDEALDPRRVSEVLRELLDELISRYEMLFRVERKANDTPTPDE
jgi:hypothetical protein